MPYWGFLTVSASRRACMFYSGGVINAFPADSSRFVGGELQMEIFAPYITSSKFMWLCLRILQQTRCYNYAKSFCKCVGDPLASIFNIGQVSRSVLVRWEPTSGDATFELVQGLWRWTVARTSYLGSGWSYMTRLRKLLPRMVRVFYRSRVLW